MYVVPPPQRSDSGSNGDLRVYQTWKGSNVSFFFFFLELGFLFLWFLFFFELDMLHYSSPFLLIV